jgi:hypothetical protein
MEATAVYFEISGSPYEPHQARPQDNDSVHELKKQRKTNEAISLSVTW